MRTPIRLLAVAATGVALSTVVVGAAPRTAAQPTARLSDAPVTGRVLFAGTQHRSLGVVTGTGPSQPLLGPGPTHFDDQPFAVGGQLVFTSRRDAATPQVYLRDAVGAIHRLTTGRDAAHPRLSPDGTLVVFDSADGAHRVLWLVHSDGTGLRRLTTSAANETEPTFSPDGTQIAFASDQAGGTDIYRRELAGGPETRLTTNGGRQPAWNYQRPDLIAYTQGTGAGRRLRLIKDTTPGNPVLAGDAEAVPSFSPAWEPDGTMLMFISVVDNVNQVRAVNACGCGPVSDPDQLLAEDRGDDSPAMLNGQLVVARSTASGQNTADLQDILPDGSDPRDLGLSVLREDPGAATDNFLLFHPNPGFDPWFERQNYSPDGTRLAVTRFETAGGRRIERIWLANADGSDAAPMPLADRAPGDWEIDPDWSPDGRSIIFTRQSPGAVDGAPTRVFIADVATGQVTGALPPSADPTLSDAQPEFSPDGAAITFTQVANVGGSLANKHIWLTSATALGSQRDLTAAACGANCPVIDDSPAFSPDGTRVAFNREHDGMLTVSTDGTGCRVLLPAGHGSCAGPVDAPDGPFQPRDIAFSPDGTQAVLTTRRAADLNSPEMLAVLDIASGRVTPISQALPGRQKEPSFQATVNVSVTAPPATPTVPLGGSATVPITVTNHGPAPSLGTTLTVDVPPGLQIVGVQPDRGTCAAARCDLGTMAPGESIGLTATLVGTAPGEQHVIWSVTGSMLDNQPLDNVATTIIPVEVPVPPPAGQPPSPANPSLAVTVNPTPGYVGGTVTVTFTARNRAESAATGLDLDIALPVGIPISGARGCTPTGCALADLAPGAAESVRIVLAPTAEIQAVVSGTLRTVGTDGNPADNIATAPLIVLQPKIIAVPAVGKPGFVTSVRGTDFPPGAPVTLTWTPGITASAAPAHPRRDGTFIAQLLILAKDQTGPRVITASGPGFSPVTTAFLVVPGVYTPPDLVVRR
ncbi:DUF11 domain-containing protein [Actinocrispum wychmicini]|uniref:WD40 repeat protein n=1 Tax=Actinocrispum wychmicini TaxID=1213861 RepID=A0A4R2JCM7_9PSEU|nr:DUF11 domain-containing protein [Actinocrispum wychmicini]TCO55782.1 WD40 repeat protein [Actinocrispum wychmicini]